MIIESTLPILFPLKEAQLPLQAVEINGSIDLVEITIGGIAHSFKRDSNGRFKNSSATHLEPAYIAYVERQLSRRFN